MSYRTSAKLTIKALRQLISDCRYTRRHANDRLPIQRCGSQTYFEPMNDRGTLEFGRRFDRVPAWLRKLVVKSK